MRTIVLLTSVASLAACNPFQPNDIDTTERSVTIPAIDWSANARMEADDHGFLDVEAGRFEGTLPRIGSFADEAPYGSISMDTWDGYGYLHLDLNTFTPGEGWGMVGVGLDLDLETGEATYSAADLIGCSGAQEYDPQYDEAPTTGVIEAEVIEVDGQEMVEIRVIATFEGEEVVGTAVVPAADPGVDVTPAGDRDE